MDRKAGSGETGREARSLDCDGPFVKQSLAAPSPPGDPGDEKAVALKPDFQLARNNLTWAITQRFSQ
jgi:hypothetical protein